LNIKKTKKTTIAFETRVCTKPTIRVIKIDEEKQKCGQDICTGIKSIILTLAGSSVTYTECPPEKSDVDISMYKFYEEPVNLIRFEASKEKEASNGSDLKENFFAI